MGDAEAAFDSYAGKDGSVAVGDLAALCADLGEPLSHSDLDEAIALLDDGDTGAIEKDIFLEWWASAAGAPASPGRGSGVADSSAAPEDAPGDGSKLSAVRHLRKQAQNDAQLLINRIALLRQEELKARKKIQQTQSRAQEMLALKQRTLKKIERKASLERAAEKKQALIRSRVVAQKEEHAKKVVEAQRRIAEQKVAEVREVHDMRKRFKNERQRNQAELVEKARRKHEAVKAREGGAARAQEERQRQMQLKVMAEYERKINDEVARRRDKEAEVRAMETEELRLIEALKRVQVVQREAFEELEAALAGGSNESMRRGARRGSRSSRAGDASVASRRSARGSTRGSTRSTKSKSKGKRKKKARA